MMLFAAHYEMPFDVVRDDIHKSVKETVKQLRKRFAERPDLKGSASVICLTWFTPTNFSTRHL